MIPNRAARSRSARETIRFFLALTLLLSPSLALGQSLSVKWEELSSAEFVKAIQQSQGTCLLPIGIMEKHGLHLPLGNDLINVRYASLHAAEQEYTLVFPEYYFSQIFEARHQPGTVAYSARLQLDLLQETTDEMGRNGCKKIVIVNGHGGNEHLLPFFAQAQLASPHDYVVYVFNRPSHSEGEMAGRPAMKSSNYAVDFHAGEGETSRTMVARPDLVHLDRAKNESGADQARQKLPDSLYTGIWWYARFPNHYAGDGSAASKELGEFDTKMAISDLIAAIRAVKADTEGLKLQKQFFEEATHPLDTKQ
jgi:creatinine amidohydrolase